MFPSVILTFEEHFNYFCQKAKCIQLIAIVNSLNKKHTEKNYAIKNLVRIFKKLGLK